MAAASYGAVSFVIKPRLFPLQTMASERKLAHPVSPPRSVGDSLKVLLLFNTKFHFRNSLFSGSVSMDSMGSWEPINF